jgi:hypothetical protein
MNWFIVLFCIISVILYFITKTSRVEHDLKKQHIDDEIEAFETEENRTTTEKLKDHHNVVINYLTISKAQELVKKNGEYIQNMNQANLSARKCESIDDLYNKYKNGFQDISDKEKETVDHFILDLLNDIKRFNPSYYRYICKWINDISIAKAQSWLEAGMPHTLEKTIVMDANWFVDPRKTTFVHEMMHIHQRQIDFDFEDLYKELGYYYYPQHIKGMEDIYPLNRNNPDGLSKYWLWKMPKVSKSNSNSSSLNSTDTINASNINNYWWIGALFKTITPESLNDVNLVALKLDRDSDGHFYYLKQYPTLLNKWKPFIAYFGDNPNNYHPNEMTAKFAEYFLLDILNDRNREFDNYEGYKIFKHYFENMCNKYY